ncbi:MAG: hypothetical protein WD232_08325 [Acidimicrobiales bacterium]
MTAEGHFGVSETGVRFRLAVGLAATDAMSCHLLSDLLGVGTITRSTRRKLHYDDEVSWQVQSVRDLVEVVVPFMDEHLPPSHKRDQYLAWRAALLEYWEHGMRRRRPCRRDGCEEPSRCKGLCRRHYYAAYGR